MCHALATVRTQTDCKKRTDKKINKIDMAKKLPDQQC